jgi:hypothetical protein
MNVIGIYDFFFFLSAAKLKAVLLGFSDVRVCRTSFCSSLVRNVKSGRFSLSAAVEFFEAKSTFGSKRGSKIVGMSYGQQPYFTMCNFGAGQR